MSNDKKLLKKGNKMKTIIFTSDLNEKPIDHIDDVIVLNADAYYLDDEMNVFILKIGMDEDFYLDLLIQKLKEDEDKAVYYTFSISGNLKKLLEKNEVTMASDGVIVIISDSDDDLNYIEIIKNG